MLQKTTRIAPQTPELKRIDLKSAPNLLLKLGDSTISPTLYTGSVKLGDLFYFTASTELSTATASGAGYPFQRIIEI